MTAEMIVLTCQLVIAFSDIVAMEKKSTAGIFPNAVQISTLQAKVCSKLEQY